MSRIWDRVAPTRKPYTLSLHDEAPKHRLELWRSLMRERSMELSGDFDAGAIQGSVSGQAFEGGILARWTQTRQKLIRTPQAARKLDDEYVFVSVVIDGQAGFEQGSETSGLRPGDFTVVDARQPFTATTSSLLATRGFLHVRKSALRQRLGSREHLAYGVYRSGQPLQGLASSFLTNLTGLVGHVDDTTLSTLVAQSLDIIALLANERHPLSIEPSTHKAAMLLRLKAHMKANLRSSSYGIEVAATELGVTSRYINSLLALENSSFNRRLMRARLEGARQQIIEARYVHRQITEIAFDWGFNNASHFGKVFKDTFGVTPREARSIAIFEQVGKVA